MVADVAVLVRWKFSKVTDVYDKIGFFFTFYCFCKLHVDVLNFEYLITVEEVVLIRKTTTIIFIPNLRFSPKHSVIIFLKKNVHHAQTFSQTRTGERRGEGGEREFFPFWHIQQKDLHPQENEK